MFMKEIFIIYLVICAIGFFIKFCIVVNSLSRLRDNKDRQQNAAMSLSAFLLANPGLTADDYYNQQVQQQQHLDDQNRFMEQMQSDSQRDMETAQHMHDQAVDLHHQAVEMFDHSFNDFNSF